MLKIENLTVVHKKDLTPIVEDLSFTLSGGERLALIGEEGNGKSTLLAILAQGGRAPDYVEVTGRVISDARIGYLPQELPAEARELGCYEYFCREPAFFDATPRELGELAVRLSLPADVFYSAQRMREFSGGERIKLQLARALLGSPDTLLLDEPTNDLDAASVRWLEDFLLGCALGVLFVSHDEALLSRAATGVVLLERLRHRQKPRATVFRGGYDAFVASREAGFERQGRVARKEREEKRERLERYERIRQRVEHEQNVISRGDPAGAAALKKKMHAVMAMGRRFEREETTPLPEREDAIFAKLDCAPLPPGKTVLDTAIPELRAPDGRLLAEDVRLTVRGREKLAIIGANGAGKSTLLRLLAARLRERADLRLFYMPQDPGDLFDLSQTPVELLAPNGDARERAAVRTALGSLKFTAEEAAHPASGLSGGQKAKLAFLAMARSGANVLLLDEPTRSLSPLSGPVVRALLAAYPGCIVAVTHDRRLAGEVCPRVVRLTREGMMEAAIEE